MDKSPDAFRTISEVAEYLETPAHVLRFWESRFPQIKPVKRAGGRRYYRPADVALLAGIRKLLHDEGMTIRGVQKILRDQGVRHVSGMTDSDVDSDLALPDSPFETAVEGNVVALTEWRQANEDGETPSELRDALRGADPATLPLPPAAEYVPTAAQAPVINIFQPAAPMADDDAAPDQAAAPVQWSLFDLPMNPPLAPESSPARTEAHADPASPEAQPEAPPTDGAAVSGATSPVHLPRDAAPDPVPATRIESLTPPTPAESASPPLAAATPTPKPEDAAPEAPMPEDPVPPMAQVAQPLVARLRVGLKDPTQADLAALQALLARARALQTRLIEAQPPRRG